MWKIMGFDKYPQPHNNRQLGVSVGNGVHMFAYLVLLRLQHR